MFDSLAVSGFNTFESQTLNKNPVNVFNEMFEYFVILFSGQPKF